jgi:hypothetical protein
MNTLACVETKETLADEHCSASEEEDSDVEDINTDESPTEAKEKIASTLDERLTEKGIITDIVIYKDWHLRKQAKRWKKTNKVRHAEVGRQIQMKNLVAYALRQTIQMQNNGSLVFRSAQDNSTECRPYFPHDFVVPVQFCNGWAKRHKIGAMYGPKYLEKYRTEISEMYLFGEEDKKNKKSPAQMLEILSKKYPKEFCLPSESDIRTEINKLQTTKKRGRYKRAKNEEI